MENINEDYEYIASSKDALVVVDVQNDFCTGGNLAVENAERIVPGINAVMQKFDNIILTQDWHPAGHSSFASSHEGKNPSDQIELDYGMQTLWPDHCIQGSEGAAFRPELNLTPARLIIRKGTDPDLDSYSGFNENDKKTSTGLADFLRAIGIERVFFAGIAGDYCVGWSAEDCAQLGFKTVLLNDLIASISDDDYANKMTPKLTALGAKFIESHQVA